MPCQNGPDPPTAGVFIYKSISCNRTRFIGHGKMWFLMCGKAFFTDLGEIGVCIDPKAAFFAELWQIAPTAYAAKQLILLKVFKC